MAQEMIDVYNVLGQPSGQVKGRDLMHKDGDWHATVHAWIFNKHNEILLQKRSKTKPIYPGMLVAPISGHVTAGQGLVDTVIKEAYEEANVKLTRPDLMLLGMRQFEYHDLNMPFHDKEFVYTYVVRKPVVIDIAYTNDEVTGFVWKSKQALAKLVKDKSSSLVPCWAEYSMVLDYLDSRT